MRTNKIIAKIYDSYDIDPPKEIIKNIDLIEWASIRSFDKDYVFSIQKKLSSEILSFISSHLNDYLIKDVRFIYEFDGNLSCHLTTQDSYQSTTNKNSILINFIV